MDDVCVGVRPSCDPERPTVDLDGSRALPLILHLGEELPGSQLLVVVETVRLVGAPADHHLVPQDATDRVPSYIGKLSQVWTGNAAADRRGHLDRIVNALPV